MQTKTETPEPVDITVGLRVRTRREALNYSQSDLGKACGLTFQQIQKYEKAVNRISASRLKMIADFLRVPISYFFDETPEARGMNLPFDQFMTDRYARDIVENWKDVPIEARMAAAQLLGAFPERTHA